MNNKVEIYLSIDDWLFVSSVLCQYAKKLPEDSINAEKCIAFSALIDKKVDEKLT